MDLDAIREGDVAALGALMDDAWDPLLRYLGSRTDSPDAAQDAAQEAFVRLWENRERWRGPSARAVLFRIARNVALDQARRRSVRRAGAESLLQEPPATAPGPSEELAAAMARDRVVSALETLPERRREVFELVRFDGLSYREVADALELSAQTVANHMSLALRDLRLLLDRSEGPSPERAERDEGRQDVSTDGA